MSIMYHNKNDDNEVATSSKEEGDELNEGLKKGPWTTEEDTLLREHVLRHGEGNWNSVKRISGLARCGKSCRLRWNNHLRPDLKKGSFSEEEEDTIIKLHAKLGNKWALMAARLPGRTDNEIKNFWNARMKKRQRAGLPLYPRNLQKESNKSQQIEQHSIKPHSPPPSLSFSSFHSSLYLPDINELTHSCTPSPQQNETNSSFLSNSYPQFTFSNNMSVFSGHTNFPLFSHFSPYGYSLTNPYQNQSLTSSVFCKGVNSNVAWVESPNESLTLNQSSPTGSTTTPNSSSHASDVYGLIGANSNSKVNSDYHEVAVVSPRGAYSAVLDSPAMDLQSLSCSDMLKNEHSTKNTSSKRKCIDDSEFVQQSTGKKLNVEGTFEGINCMDDGLFGLLNLLSSETSMPGWFHDEERPSLELKDASSNSINKELDRNPGPF
ncbi:hypothetical protein RJT34_31105 [Clitoria ternatea]|uniref:Uncharacterized protein n=1 Tax=Clitoria ternatea TaxID=43366 RepID=A0AAN9I3A2_CLITE